MENLIGFYAYYVLTICCTLPCVTTRDISRSQQDMVLCGRKIRVYLGDAPEMAILVTHPFLDVTSGIVPGVEYSVTVQWTEVLSEDTVVAITSDNGSFHHSANRSSVCDPYNRTIIITIQPEKSFTITWVPHFKEKHNSTVKITTLLSHSETEWNMNTKAYYKLRNSCLQVVRSAHESVLSSDFGDILAPCSHFYLLLESPVGGHQLVQFQILNITQEGKISVHLRSEKATDFSISPNDFKTHLLRWIKSSSRYLLLGFHACAQCYFRVALSTMHVDDGCKATFSTEEGILEDPLPQNCTYHIITKDAQRSIYLLSKEREEGKIELCPNDYISIENAQDNKIILCPSQKNKYLTSLDNKLIVRISSPNRTTLMYKAIVTCKNATFTDESGTVCSLGSYGRCLYTITVPIGYSIHLDVLYMEIPYNSTEECKYNYVRLIGVGDDRKYCGNWTGRTDKLRSLSNSLIVEDIIEDPSFTNRRFCVAYRAVATNDTLTACTYGWTSGAYYCYRLFTSPAEWSTSNDICGNYGGHLAAVTDATIGELLNAVLLNSPHVDPSQAFWIGANDLTHENCFEWSDGQLFDYSNWFTGWEDYKGYNSQPSDDGLANQDCVELRRSFGYPSKGQGVTVSYYWNDRDCSVANSFICQIPRPGITVTKYVRPSCNRTINLDLGRHRDVITTPSYPGTYPSNVDCQVNVEAPKGSHLEIQFSDFLLEDHKSCQYDVMKMEDGDEQIGEGYCGDWTSKIKLLRYVTKSNRLRIHFVSDFSHNYRGFRAEVSMKTKKKTQSEEEAVCGSRLFRRHLRQCYLVASYPEVSWDTARRICNETQSQLAELTSPDEKHFVYSMIRTDEGYMSGVVYWLGAKRNAYKARWQWLSGKLVQSNDFVTMEETSIVSRPSCLAIQWRHHNSTSDLFWTGKRCNHSGRYICKKSAFVLPNKLNYTLTNRTGKLTSVNYPAHYLNDIDYVVTIKTEPGWRIVIMVNYLEIEWQERCLYDFVEITSHLERPGLKLCGSTIDASRSNYVTDANIAYLKFHSDYSVTGSGFVITWESVISGNCGVANDPRPYVTSPRYPSGYLPDLDCRHAFSAGLGNRALLTFSSFDVGHPDPNGNCTNDYLKVQLNESVYVTLCGGPETIAVGHTLMSYEEDVVIYFHTTSGNSLGGKGFNLTWQSWSQPSVHSIIYLQEGSEGQIRSHNYPNIPPSGINFTQILTAPPGYRLKVKIMDSEITAVCEDRRLTVEDVYGKTYVVCPRRVMNITLSSKLNVLRIISSTLGVKPALVYRIPYSMVKDDEYIQETLKISSVYSCLPNPCQHGGRCVQSDGKSRCECPATRTGIFCHLSWCDVRPCGELGSCYLTETGYSCECPAGYTGNQCESPITACTSSPCGEHGRCSLANDTFQCHCQLWYEGSQCERYAFRFPYKPLSQRMLEEPFWLGLITVFAVLLVILCVYCIKRKFAWKIERLLAEEIEKSKCNPSPPAARYSLSSNQLSLTPGNQSPQNCPKSIFNKFRKYSIRSNASGVSPTDREREHGRTFSFDDILRRSTTKKAPTPPAETSKNDDEKSRILASLVTSPTTRRMSLDEFIRMSERKIKEAKEDEQEAQVSEPERIKETSFSARLSPRFARHSAPSFTEFHSIREQSVEYASSSSESMEDDAATSEVQADISPTPQITPEPIEVKIENLEDKEGENTIHIPLRQKGGFLAVPSVMLSAVESQEPIENEKIENPESLLLRRKPDFLLGRKYSVDLPIPKILVTSNNSSVESDPNSPPRTPNPNKSMTYLAPLTTDRTISESNLSTSGYSSLSSPGLSRCNSSSPISDDVESQNSTGGKRAGTPHKGCHGHAKCHQLPTAFMYPVTESGQPTQYKSRTFTNAMWRKPCHHERCARRHSYQTSTDESIDDEGIGMDSIDFKIRKGELKSARELEAYMSTKKTPITGFNSLSSDTPTSSSSTRSSPNLRKGEKNKKAAGKGRKSPVASPVATPINEALAETGLHVTPSSDSDQENYPRHKSQTRRLKKDASSSPISRSRTDGACRRSVSTEKLGSHRQSKYNVLRSSSSTSIPHAASDLTDLAPAQENKRPPLLKRSTTDMGNSIEDSVESSLPSDTDEEKQSFEPLLTNEAFQSSLRRQEALLEESDSGESSSETTVLLRKDGDSIPEVEEAGTQTDITSSIVVYHQDEGLLEMS